MPSFASINRNDPLLLNPYFDDPAAYFAWRADDVLREVEITPNPESPQVEIIVQAENPEVEPIAAASIQHYGLNRQTAQSPEIPDLRSV